MSEWRPIEEAVALKRPSTTDDGVEVLVCHQPTGKMRIGVVFDFTGDDGTVRRGVGQSLGIFMATHWMPLPDPPKPAKNSVPVSEWIDKPSAG